jgi:hypothetical protein
MKKFPDVAAGEPARLQTCAQCGVEKPATAFLGPTRCKPCVLGNGAAIAADLDRKRAEQAKQPKQTRRRKAAKTPAVRPSPTVLQCEVVAPETVKRCKTCREDKLLDGFGLHPRGAHGRRASCKHCVAAGMAERKTTPEQRARWKELNRKPAAVAKQRAAAARWRSENKAATRAMDRLNAAVRKSFVAKSPCCQIAGCGATKNVVGHHHDYDAPLDVLWICKTDHRRLHNGAQLELIDGLPERLLGVPETFTSVRRPTPQSTEHDQQAVL